MQPTSHLRTRSGRSSGATFHQPSPLRRAALAAVALLVLAPACTSSLSAKGSDSDKSGKSANGNDDDDNAVATAWPARQSSHGSTSPAFTDVSLSVRPIVREADGTATLFIDVDNQSTEELLLSDLSGDSELHGVSLYDAQGRTRYAPLLTESDTCVCSTNTPIPAGSEVTLHVTYGEVPTSVDRVRVTIPLWTPIDDVPVTDIGTFEAAGSVTTSFEDEPGHQVRIERVWRTDKGLVVRVQDRNEGDDVINPSDLAPIDSLSLVDLRGGRLASTRTASASAVVTEAPSDPLPSGDTVTRDVLVSNLPSEVSTVVVKIPNTRRTLPVTVASDGPSTSLELSGLDEPATASLTSSTSRTASGSVELAKPDLPDISETGAELDLPPAGQELTSDAQPGWTVSPRAVVRTGDAQSVLFLDFDPPAEGYWPEDLGASPASDALAGIALVDPAEKQRYGAIIGDDGATGSERSVALDTGTARTVHVAFPAIDEATGSVTVDVPGFGQAAEVPVIAAPTVEDGADVLATTRPDSDEGLRLDVLAIGRLAGDNGTLVRFRAVNEGNPDAVTAPFVANQGCDLNLVDPDTNRRFQSLDPCRATLWDNDLGSGEELTYELRFPNLPSDVSSVVLDGTTITSTPSIPVADDVRPWYLDLPRSADATEGDTLKGSVGFADDLQTEIRTGDEVALQLDTDVLFEFGSADLTPDARARILAVGERLSDQTSGEMTVVGHTDSVGDEAPNVTLSEQRAQAVADVLAEVSGNQFELTVSGKGEAEPVAGNEIEGRDNPDGRARNRRVTITYQAD